MLSSSMHTYLLPHVITDIIVAARPPMNLYSREVAMIACSGDAVALRSGRAFSVTKRNL